MELREYLAMARRWAWLLILGTVLGAAGGLAASLLQTPIYQASTRILVLRPASQGASADLTYLNDQQLAQTYTQLLTTAPVLRSTSAELGYDVHQKQIHAQQ